MRFPSGSETLPAVIRRPALFVSAETKKIKVSGGICSRFKILKRLKAFQGGRLWIRPQAFRKKAFRQALAGYKFAPCLLLQAAARRAYWIINQLSDFQEESLLFRPESLKPDFTPGKKARENQPFFLAAFQSGS